MPHSVVFSFPEADRELCTRHLFLKINDIAAERFRVFPGSRYFVINSPRETAESFKVLLNSSAPLELVVRVLPQHEDVLRLHKTHGP